MAPHRIVNKGGARVQLGVVAEQLDVARLQHEVQAQPVAERERVVQAQRLVLLLSQQGHLRVPLRQGVVGSCVGRAQEALHSQADLRLHAEPALEKHQGVATQDDLALLSSQESDAVPGSS